MNWQESRVLMLHGAGGGGWEWNVWRRVFAASGGKAAAPDLQPSADGIEATAFADYQRQVVDHLADAESSVLIGASLGGLLALSVAAEVKPRALVLINPMPPAPQNRLLPEHPPYPPLIPWGCEASLQSTRRALPDADEATCLFAFRRWRDESGAVMNTARAGIDIVMLECPVLIIASGRDKDIPGSVSEQLAELLKASLLWLPEASHVGPLLGRQAAHNAAQAVGWLNALA